MVPVMLLSDGYLANGSEPWKLPEISSLKPIKTRFRTDPNGFLPYLRDPQTLARPWAKAGTDSSAMIVEVAIRIRNHG